MKKKQAKAKKKSSGAKKPPFKMNGVSFQGQQDRCAADLYLPKNRKKGKKIPIVIMAHGFAAERTFGLPAFAESFVKNGLAVLLFDYRGFGDSTGKLRNHVSAGKHKQDWQAAFDYAASLEEIDSSAIVLWGSSFGGGHVLVTAAANPTVKAVISQVPFVDGIATLFHVGIVFAARAVFHALLDVITIVLRLKPHRIKVFARPGEMAVMNKADSFEGYSSIVDKDSQWQNNCPARVMLTTTFYRPISRAKTIQCPTLIIGAEHDSLIPVKAVRKTASKIRGCMMAEYEVGHFDIYSGEIFEQVRKLQVEFLRNLLRN